jgi:hypothetical protein
MPALPSRILARHAMAGNDVKTGEAGRVLIMPRIIVKLVSYENRNGSGNETDRGRS